MRVQFYSQSLKKSWDNFVQQAKNATFLFERNYMDYHSDRFDDSSLVIYKKEKIIALLPANKVENTIHSHQGLSYGGVITSSKTTFQDTLLIYIAILHFFKKNKFQKLHLKIFPIFYSNQPSQEVDYLLHLLQAKKTRCDITLAINQENKIGYNTNKKRKLKEADKTGLTIEKSTDFQSFWNDVLIPNLKEAHNLVPIHCLAEIELLHTHFPKNIELYLVYKNNKTIAGTVIYTTNRVAHAQYISANSLGKELGALDYLFDYLINKEYSNKAIFDFGIVNQGNGINFGLTFWKEAFGARTYCHDFYEVDTSKVHLLKQLLDN